MSLQIWQGRRKVLCVIGAIAVGGYASYRIYTSECVLRKRKQIFGFLQNLSRLCEVVADGTESAALVCGDLRAFLLSEEDDIPRSIKQACKVMQCREFQLGVASLSHGVLHGVIGGKADKNSNIVFENKQEVTDKVYYVDHRTQNGMSSSANNNQQSELDVDHDCKISADKLDTENDFSRQMGCSFKEWLINGKVSDNGIHNCVKPVRDHGDSQGDLLERLMDKLFSEHGKGFASVVVGSVARNAVYVVLEVMKRSKKVEHEKDCMTERSEGEVHALNERNSHKCLCKRKSKSCSTNFESIIDFASDSKGKTLIAECIEVFVATAVSVYLDKTKDINVYEGLVAGLTKPSHQAPAKNLLGFVCNGAVDTLVRTSHEVLSRRSGYEDNRSDLQQNEQVKEHGLFAVNSDKCILKVDISNADAKEGNSMRQHQSAMFVHSQVDSSVKSIAVLSADLDGLLDSQRASPSISSSTFDSSEPCRKKDTKERWLSQLQDSGVTVTGQHDVANGGSLSFVDGLSKALAVPNIRKLVIEVAGAITFQAIQSFFNVILAFFKPVHDGQAREQGRAGTLSWHDLPCLNVDKVSHVAKSIAANCLVAMTLWLAVAMHVTSGVLECI